MTLDAQLLDLILQLRTPVLTPVMVFFTELGSMWGAIGVTVVAAAILAACRRWRGILILLLSVAGSAFVMTILKAIIFRARPPEIYALVSETSPAFPSGHAMVAIALYGVLATILWRSQKKHRGLTAYCLLLIAFLIGFSRLYLGVHWPTDVLGGYVLGALWLWVSYRVVYRTSP